MKISNRLMLLGGVVGLLVTALPPAMAQGGHGLWSAGDANQDGVIERTEFNAMHEARFLAMDADGNGLVSQAEFVAAHEQQRAERAKNKDEWREGHAAMMLQRMDSSGDGRVTADEWQAAALRRFVAMDADGDGAVTADEMQAHHGKRQHGMMGDQAGQHGRGPERFMQRFDSDGDGQVSRSEWDAAGEQMFVRMDENADGKIDMSERHMRYGQMDDAPAAP
ncbi:MAG: EF-hand domain-containing protein [Rhodospirillaceae bacterium]|nr:EF-hand domain-containing protein [Rhodospirillaceae bacterium]